MKFALTSPMVICKFLCMEVLKSLTHMCLCGITKKQHSLYVCPGFELFVSQCQLQLVLAIGLPVHENGTT